MSLSREILVQGDSYPHFNLHTSMLINYETETYGRLLSKPQNSI